MNYCDVHTTTKLGNGIMKELEKLLLDLTFLMISSL